MSERKPQPKKSNDFPVARGVSPPPVPNRRPQARPAAQPPKPATRRPAGPPPLPRTAARPAAASEFTFHETGGRVFVRRHVHKRPAHCGWTLAVEIGAVVVLAGFFMAAGWYFLGQHTPDPAPVAANARPETKATKPAIVVEPAKPVEKPAAPAVPTPPPSVVKEPPQPVEKPVEKPAAPTPPPAPPVAKPTPPPPKPTAPATTNLIFARDIFPMLKNKCWSCHGENKKKLKGGLDVSTLALLEKGGDSGPALNRKDPETSPLWDTVASGQMPPGKSNKLSESEKKKLHDWIVGGGK